MNYEYSNLTDVRLIKKVLPIFLSRILPAGTMRFEGAKPIV